MVAIFGITAVSDVGRGPLQGHGHGQEVAIVAPSPTTCGVARRVSGRTTVTRIGTTS